MGSILQFAGSGSIILGVTDFYLASIQTDRNQRNALLRMGAKSLALGIAGLVLGKAQTYFASLQDIKEVTLDPSKGITVDPDTAKILMGEHFDPETQGLKVDPTVCNLEALNSIVEKKLPHANKALFHSFTCEEFLPWNHEKFVEHYSSTRGIDPKDLTKPIMWGIGPSKEPFIAMTDPNKEDFFSMRFSKNTYSDAKLLASCRGMYDKHGAARDFDISSQLDDGLHLFDKDYIKGATYHCPKIADVFFSFLAERVKPAAIYSVVTQTLNNTTNSI